jgi:hypothetical protein
VGGIIDHHDCVLPGEGHCVTSVRDFIEFHARGEGPQDHEILHHIIVLDFVLDEVRVVRAGLLEESLEMICQRPHLALAAVCHSRGTPHAGAACFLTVATVVAGHSNSPLRTLLAPLLDSIGTLLGVMYGDIGWRVSDGMDLTSWRYNLSTPSVVGGGETFRGLAAVASI